MKNFSIFGFFKKKTSFPSIDQRRESRYQAEDEFVLEFHQKKASRCIGSSRDISVHGLRFVTRCKLHRKDKLVLTFRLPAKFTGEKQFSVAAEVVRIYRPRGAARYRVGCRLDHENETTKTQLRQLIAWLGERRGFREL